MAKIQTAIVDRPGRASPAALANTIAILSWYPGFDTITTAQRLGDVATLGLWGKGADLGAFALRESDERGNPATMYFVPCAISTIGSITDNGATGFGPTQTMTTADSARPHPYDDATVKVRIRDAGIPGVATFELSTAYSVTRDVNGGNPTITSLYTPAQNMPAETAAQLTGTVNLASIVYAKPAIVTGSVDIVNSTTLYGSAGTLAGKEFDIDIDGATTVTVAFGTGASAPGSYTAALATINTAITGAGTASVTNTGRLRLTGIKVSAADGEIILAAGTPDALAPLGLAAATTAGVNGALDGLTLIYNGDATSGSQTWTLPSNENALQSAEALVATATALTGVDASLYSTANYLRIGSATLGSASTFTITGGTGRSALGLPLASATGAASVVVIEHLGVKVTFPQGTYSSGYERTWTLKAPAHSITDVQNAITTMVAAGIRVGRIVCPSYVPIGNVAGFIQGAASKVGLLESANDAHFLHFAFGAPTDESDTAVKAAFVSGVAGDKNVGRRVDLATRVHYVRPARSSPNNTGSLVRSPLWSLTARYASLPLGSDVGQHNVGPLSYVDYAPVDEDAATVKHSALRVDTVDPRAMTLQQWADGLYFTAGFTLAPSASAYADQYVRDITLRVAQLVHASMRQLLNDPTLATDPATGKLTDSGAGKVASTGIAVLSPLIAPRSATEEERSRYLLTSARVEPNRDEVIGGPSGTQRIKVDVTFSVNGIPRDIRITVGAGLLSAEEGQG